ncbi:mycofactocin biosynthesis chaperone MftB [Nocardiopsis mangrovi]|uniref:Mycofactocin biosynthesis chaperone MftB n=1 Tax=Nocardiopsis mangrovi TaxID=1179818 RepID=A0ABV9DX24_9ACTN
MPPDDSPAPHTPPAIDLDGSWDLHPQVAVRPEPFGALLYHFGTRRLSFLKDPRLLAVVRALPGHATARAACDDAGVGAAELPRYARALATLAATGMVVRRGAGDVESGRIGRDQGPP